MSAAAPSWRNSTHRLRLPRLWIFQVVSTPLTRQWRSVSPSRGSTFTTSAPKSTRCCVSRLPATRRERSTTRSPLSGPRTPGV